MHGLVYGGIIAVVFLTIAAGSIWFERKFAGRMQSRVGPTLVGPAGLLQVIADAVKMLQKEDITPASADRALFKIAPVFVVVFALLGLAVVPMGQGIVAADLDIGVLYIMAMAGLMIFPNWIAGWASNNKYALLGAMRGVAQGVSYEIPLVLTAMVPVILAGSMNLSDIVHAQAGGHWFIFWPPGPGLVAFIIFFLSSLAEANRIPFDIPEAESELVAGVTTEYTGMKFGLFYMAEYLHTLITSAVGAALFFGGWDGPISDGVHWMAIKTLILFFLVFWVRWTLVRFRADQLMRLCWVWLLPISLATVMISSLWVYLDTKGIV